MSNGFCRGTIISINGCDHVFNKWGRRSTLHLGEVSSIRHPIPHILFAPGLPRGANLTRQFGDDFVSSTFIWFFFVAFCLIPMYQKILTLCLAPLKIKVSNFRNSRVSFCSLANHVAPSSERASVIIRLGDSAIDLCYTPTKIRSAFFSSIPIDHPNHPISNYQKIPMEGPANQYVPNFRLTSACIEVSSICLPPEDWICR